VGRPANSIEQESGQTLTQTRLALASVPTGIPGSPATHSAALQETPLRYLLPADSGLLYGVLVGPRWNGLTALRRAKALGIWDARGANKTAGRPIPVAVINDVLALFDGDATAFSIKRVQDENHRADGRVAGRPTTNSLTLENRRDREPAGGAAEQRSGAPAPQSGNATARWYAFAPTGAAISYCAAPGHRSRSHRRCRNAGMAPILGKHPAGFAAFGRRSQTNACAAISCRPAPTTERLQANPAPGGRQDRRGAADFGGRKRLAAIPVQAGGLYPIFRCSGTSKGLGRARPSCAWHHRAVRARESPGEAGSEAHRGHRRRHRLPLRH